MGEYLVPQCFSCIGELVTLNKKVIIACYDKNVRCLLENVLKGNRFVSDVVECKFQQEVLWMSSKLGQETVVFCDKYFYGYKLKDKIEALKRGNPKAEICFCDVGSCVLTYGHRIFYLKGDGYITHIDDEVHLKNEIEKKFSGMKVFPVEIERDIETKLISVPKNYTDVSDEEQTVAYYLGQGMRQNEIANLLGKSQNTVDVQASSVRNKTAHRSPLDFGILNEIEYGITYRDLLSSENFGFIGG